MMEESGKLKATSRGRNVVIASILVTSNAEKHLDALFLTIGNVFFDVVAFAKKFRLLTPRGCIGSSPAVASKVGARVAAGVVLWRDIDKGQSNIVDTSITLISQTILMILTLNQNKNKNC